MLKDNCEIVKDLLPMYVEQLTSESSNQFIEEHLEFCEECQNYLENLQKDLPVEEVDYTLADKEDQELLKDIKKRLKNRTFITTLIGILIGLVVSMQLFPWAMIGLVAFLLFIAMIIYLMY